MARDIEEFLRQAAQRRQEKLRELRQRLEEQQQPGPVPPRQQPRRQQREPEVVEAEEAPPQVDRLSQRHVESQVDTSRITSRAEGLGRAVGEADDRADSRIHRKFDHNVSRFGSAHSPMGVGEIVDKSRSISPLARTLFDMLSSPEGIRQALVLNEVLTRRKFD